MTRETCSKTKGEEKEARTRQTGMERKQTTRIQPRLDRMARDLCVAQLIGLTYSRVKVVTAGRARRTKRDIRLCPLSSRALAFAIREKTYQIYDFAKIMLFSLMSSRIASHWPPHATIATPNAPIALSQYATLPASTAVPTHPVKYASQAARLPLHISSLTAKAH